MRIVSALMVVLMTCVVPSAMADNDRPEVGKYPKVFKSYGQAVDLTVTMVRVGPKADNTFLIEFRGVDSEWDGKIMKHSCKVWGMQQRKIDCCTDKIRGEKYCSFIGRDGWFGQGFEAYLPDVRPETIHVYYTKEGSRQVNPEHFLTKYLKQQASAGKKKLKR